MISLSVVLSCCAMRIGSSSPFRDGPSRPRKSSFPLNSLQPLLSVVNASGSSRCYPLAIRLGLSGGRWLNHLSWGICGLRIGFPGHWKPDMCRFGTTNPGQFLGNLDVPG